jgi:hypothetical protein
MIKTRAAVDLGSGTIKMQAALVDTRSNTLLEPPFYSKYLPLSLTEDAAINAGYISDKAIQSAIDILELLKGEVASASISHCEFSGIATAVFRNAFNGKEALREIEKTTGIRFELCSQQLEGELGYLTAKAQNNSIHCENLIAWDSGYGSFQLTSRKKEGFDVYLGPVGHGSVRVLLSTTIRNNDEHLPCSSLNPISMQEALELQNHITSLLPPPPAWLREKVSSKEAYVATFGDIESIFSLALQTTGKPWFIGSLSAEHAMEQLPRYLDCVDTVLDAQNIHRKTGTALIFLTSVMKHLDIRTIHFKQTLGSTLGMLISDRFWH